ncbi:PD-(D/E)XK nuclease family protein [Wenzhouxiangella sp. EGI_FJ10305]|uniref:PD-(D/E)XK nuclease family protein n=1 Tax=Wenzhouxiangella sp. EGI_FJ10305 TaxID=3243768 RepID=UPI0035D67933
MTGEQTFILTPTARLARAEKQRHAMARQSAGEQAWQSPEVLAFSSWINRLRDEWFLTTEAPLVPISASQALVLWQSVIDRDVFIGEPRVAEMATASWRLVHEYRIDAPADWPELMLSEDSRHFRDWARRFVEVCEQRELLDEWRFAGQLPERIAAGEISLPQTVLLSGFELPMTPLQRAILDAAEAAGTRIEREPAPQDSVALETISVHSGDEDELLAAARWARGRLEENIDQNIAIVVPDLRQRLGTVERVFRQVFDPGGFALEARRDEPWHVSLGPALSRWALVADALTLLRIDPHRISQPEAAAVMRSPFLAGREEETRARAEALATVIRRRPWWLHAGQIAWQAGHSGARQLSTRMAEWELLRREHRDATLPSRWVARFQKELGAAGFGRGRALDSREFQVLQRFHDLLEDFSALDLVIERPISRSEALRRLGERAAGASFRERNPGAPVEILGVEEALGSRFDAIRITGLDHHTWPSPTQRDPFIPAGLQATVPAATAEGALDRARAELTGLARAATVVTGSYSRGSEDELRHLTPLLGDCPVEEATDAASFEPAPMDEAIEDTRAPSHPGGEVRGGTAVLQRQSDCPFKAFAETRLGAGELMPPRPGLDARDRGSLVHKALECFWRGLEGLDALKALDEDALADRIASARDAALEEFSKRSPLALTDAGLVIEAQCLERALAKWLSIERERAAFSVTALESDIELAFGGLTLTGKIDRVDEIEGGGTVVIDYKTGAAGKGAWVPEARLADVQLPAYAASLDPRPAAIAFARLRPDSMGFDGLAEVDAGIPGVAVIGEIRGNSKFRGAASWPSLVDDWRDHLEFLAADFRDGKSEVHPRDHQVCKYCHLHALCRINERVILPEADNE